jgi:hypothetical protein
MPWEIPLGYYLFYLVIAGLDPAIHLYEENGCAGQARA